MTVTVSMSSVWLRRITTVCLFFTALSRTGSSGVVWKDVGEQITIQCRSTKLDQEYLTLNKGLQEEFQVLYRDRNSGKNTIATQFTGRLQLNGEIPNVDILLKNLTLGDTGPYWCVYKKFDSVSHETKIMKGTGSVLLVVKDPTQQCDRSDKNLVLGSVVISAAVLLGIVLAFLIWFFLKTKISCTSEKPTHVSTNDVYEDMRGTLRS